MDVIMVYLFIVGLFFGSFYNVVAERCSRDESIIKPGSHCPNCKHRLTWYELIPVFSYLFLRGKCKVCHIKISPQYLLVELITGFSYALSYIICGVSIDTLISIILVSVAIITFITDIKYYIILDEVVVTGVIFTLIVYLIFDRVNILTHIIGAISLFIIMLLIKLMGDKTFKRESLGWGDVKLSILAGLVLGFKLGLIYLFIGSLIAIIPAIFISKKNEEHIIPFGPFLVTSLLIVFYNMSLFNELFIKLIGG